MTSAYFVPRDAGERLLLGLVERGVDVSVLTNSLATTDVLAVHSGYAKSREPLLEGGVNMWELRPIAGQQERASPFLGESLASLHAKTFVFDRKSAFIGSVNLDPALHQAEYRGRGADRKRGFSAGDGRAVRALDL